MMATELDAVALLQRLIRFPSVNPPGDEGECVAYLADLLAGHGLAVRLLGSDPQRPNLLARLAGRGAAPPLLLHAHADVVPTEGQAWTHPPFSGVIIDEHVWGRGAIDMKAGLAMMVTALSRLRTEAHVPAGDILLAVSPDEETGSTVGAHYLTSQHPYLFEGVRYAVGEDGGAGFTGTPRRVHPIVVAEKRACWMRATLRGRTGHASRQGWSDTATEKLARLLSALSRERMPARLGPASERMLRELAAVTPPELSARLVALGERPDARMPYDLLPEADAVYLDSVLRDTVNATIIRTSEKINVLPATITVDLDGRILPGPSTVDDYVAQLRPIIGPEAELELLVEGEPMPPPTFDGFYDLLASVLRDADPEGVPLPMITPASTDARLFAGLGIACYGWLPLLVPAGSRYQDTMHANDERVPVAAVRFGADRFTDLLHRYR